MVKYVRNNFLLPENTILDLDQFNKTLWELAEEDRDRPHYEKDIIQSKLYEEDKDGWLILPEKEFECARYQDVRADKYGMVTIDKKQYSTSPRFAQQKVNVCIEANQQGTLIKLMKQIEKLGSIGIRRVGIYTTS